MKVDIHAAAHHRPNDPDYYRTLVEQSGYTQANAAQLIGVDQRTMRRYLAGAPVPYTVQVTLELLAGQH
ncbi:MAG: hypothetical protein ACOYB0_08345 [Polynucleobacter sp.]